MLVPGRRNQLTDPTGLRISHAFLVLNEVEPDLELVREIGFEAMAGGQDEVLTHEHAATDRLRRSGHADRHDGAWRFDRSARSSRADSCRRYRRSP